MYVRYKLASKFIRMQQRRITLNNDTSITPHSPSQGTKRIQLLSITKIDELYAQLEFNARKQRLYFKLPQSGHYVYQ